MQPAVLDCDLQVALWPPDRRASAWPPPPKASSQAPPPPPSASRGALAPQATLAPLCPRLCLGAVPPAGYPRLADPLADGRSPSVPATLPPTPGRATTGPAQSTSPITSVRSPFLKGLGLTGLSGTGAFSYTLAVNGLRPPSLGDSSEDTSPSVLTIRCGFLGVGAFVGEDYETACSRPARRSGYPTVRTGFICSPRRRMASSATGRLSMACIISWVSASSPSSVWSSRSPRVCPLIPLAPAHQHQGGSLVGRRLQETCRGHAHRDEHHRHHRPRSCPLSYPRVHGQV